MDQLKIGSFIAQCRKEKNLTQAQLAENLNITDKAISKWETGNGMPDSSIMLELCNQININVNELLRGERLSSEDYEEKVNENIINITKETEKNKRSKNRIIIIFCIILFSLLIGITAIIVYRTTEIDISYDERIIKSEITDSGIICSFKGLSLIHLSYEVINTDEETLIFITGNMLLQNKIHSHFETWDSMAQLVNGNESRFSSTIMLDKNTDIVDCKAKIKVYYTNISLKKIRKSNGNRLQQIINQSHLMSEN